MSHLKKVETSAEYNAYYNSEEYDAPNVTWVGGAINTVYYDSNLCLLKILPFIENTPRRILLFSGNTITKEHVNALSHTNNDTVIVGDSITAIYDQAFENYSGLKNIKFSDKLLSIRNSAFANCTGLTSITIPKSVTSMQGVPFNGCTNLNRVVIEDLISWMNITFTQSNSNPLYYAHNLYIKDTLLENVVIPEIVTEIKPCVFMNCQSITNVTFHNFVTKIGSNAFRGCTGLTTLNIPDSVTVIEAGAFTGCTGLTNVTIGSGISTLSGAIFNGCTNITSMTIMATVPPTFLALPVASSVFSGTYPIYVPASAVDTYKSASGWTNYASRIQAIPS